MRYEWKISGRTKYEINAIIRPTEVEIGTVEVEEWIGRWSKTPPVIRLCRNKKTERNNYVFKKADKDETDADKYRDGNIADSLWQRRDGPGGYRRGR